MPCCAKAQQGQAPTLRPCCPASQVPATAASSVTNVVTVQPLAISFWQTRLTCSPAPVTPAATRLVTTPIRLLTSVFLI